MTVEETVTVGVSAAVGVADGACVAVEDGVGVDRTVLAQPARFKAAKVNSATSRISGRSSIITGS